MEPHPGRDPVYVSAMRGLSRTHFALIWKRGRKDEPLSQEDAAIYQSMLDHPEYTDIWENAEQLSDRDVEVGGVNPFLHVALHGVIQRQIDSLEPPETAQALFRLTRDGLDRHEALHRIANVLMESLAAVLKHRPFDNNAYRRHMRALKP